MTVVSCFYRVWDERTSFDLAILVFVLVDAFCDSWRAVLMVVFWLAKNEFVDVVSRMSVIRMTI